VTAEQPVEGFRAGIDSVLLASAVPAAAGDQVLELGCGVGVASLCLRARMPGVDVLGVEREDVYAEMARRNGLEVVNADAFALPKEVKDRQFAHVFVNPPYYDPKARSKADVALREAALADDRPLMDWVEVAAKRCAPKGSVTFVQKVAVVPELLSAFRQYLGGVVLQPLIPRAGRDAQLVLIQGWRGSRAPFRLKAPMILHEGAQHMRDGEDYAPEIVKILRGAAAIELSS